MSAKDKQRLGIAVGLVIVVAAAFWFLVLRKPKAGQEAAATKPTAPAEKATGAVAPARAGAGGARGISKEAIVAALLARAARAGKAAPVVTPAEPYRADPFAPLFPPPPPPPPRPPPPPPPVVRVVGIPPVMVQALPPTAIVAVTREQPRRTAGVLWNDRVWAIVETERTTAVVQPGDRVDGDTVRAISPQGVVLAAQSGKEVEVPLRGREGGAAPMPAAVPSGRPELPGASAPSAY